MELFHHRLQGYVEQKARARHKPRVLDYGIFEIRISVAFANSDT